MFILSLLFAAFFLTTPLAAEGTIQPKVENLDGKDVVVRVYKKWQQDPAAFEIAILQVTDRKIQFDFDDVNDSAVVTVFGQDQQNEMIQQVIGDRIFGWAYKKGLEFHLPEKAQSRQSDFWWTFNDALADPIPNVPVEIYLIHEQRSVLIEQGKTDSQARLRLPFCLGYGEAILRVGRRTFGYGTAGLRFVVSHPDYGMAVVDVYSRDEDNHSHTIFIPAVPLGSEADLRSIWGVVVDPQNNPVSGLLIRATGLYPLGADWVGHIPDQSYAVITDEQGQFRLYLPTREDSEEIGTLIPPKSEYYVLIKPPKGLGLVPYKGRILNGRETIITLERAGYFRTFAFEDEKGPIRDQDQLRQISLFIKRPGKPQLWFKYDDWKAGGMFPLGTYEAMMNEPQEYKFEPIEVTADSHEQLVFHVPSGKLYCGQVVDGITDEPIEGAFVIDMDGMCSQRNLSMLTSEQWDALYALPAAVSAFDKAFRQILRPVDNCYSFSKIVRTDRDGWFEMTVPPKRAFYAFAVFEENHLSVFIPEDWAKPDDKGYIEVPITKLFPAAKVIVDPWIEGWHSHMHLTLWPKWIIDKNDNPDWVQDFLAGCKKDWGMGIRKEYCLKPNKGQSFYVPVGLNLQLQLRMPYNKEWSAITIAESINLQQGQTLDLGRRMIQPAVKVFVDVISTAGNPVEGVPVAALCRYGETTHNTDENGIAQFDLARYSKGEFVVQYYEDDPNQMYLREAVPYEIAGEEDAGCVYTLSISDDMLYYLFK